MTTILGHSAKPTWGSTYDGPGAPNQQGAIVTPPSSGKITRLGAWILGDVPPNSYAFRLVIWDAVTNAVLGYTATMYSPNMVATKYEADLTTPVQVTSGHDYLVGWAHASVGSSGDWYYPVNAAGSGTHYDSGTSYQSGWPKPFGTHVAMNYQAGMYAYFTPGGFVKVRRSGTWVDAPVKVRRSGTWVDVDGIRVRRGGSWEDL
jgi:hypothetical protein